MTKSSDKSPCQSCGEPVSRAGGKRGRASVYCSAACRQKAYRARQQGGSVPDLIHEISQRVQGLAPHLPGPFYEDVTELSSSVGRLRRIAMAAADLSAEIVTRESVTEDEWEFAALVEPFRSELHVHCYRMLGSYDDAEDLVQETLLRAWRKRETFEGRASLRAWLYKIATNACLDFLRSTKRVPTRYAPLPGMDHGGGAAPARVTWLQPYPDELLEQVVDETAGPEHELVSRETMELVFLAAIQHLPARQRAVLIMRDVLGWPAADTASLLEMSVASVNSALQRARPVLREQLPRDRSEWAASSAPSQEQREVLQRYMAAAGRSDFSALTELLAVDVRLTMPPSPYWFTDRDAMMKFLEPSLTEGSPQWFGRWKHLPTRANGCPAAAGYVQRPGTSVYRAQVLDVLRIEHGKIVEITAFEPHLFPAFGLPMTVR